MVFNLRWPVEGIPSYGITAIDRCHTEYHSNPSAYRCVFIQVNFII